MKDYRIAVGRVFLLATLLALLPAIPALADQTRIPDYREGSINGVGVD